MEAANIIATKFETLADRQRAARHKAFTLLLEAYKGLSAQQQQQLRASYHGGPAPLAAGEARKLSQEWEEIKKNVTIQSGGNLTFEMLQEVTR